MYYALFGEGHLCLTLTVNDIDQAITFCCDGSSLVGIISNPVRPFFRGVLVVVGGPQYRVGSHRQFTLLSRQLAENGIPVMRFDYRGMGDSDGSSRTFQEIEEDIRAAVDTFFQRVPGMKQVVLWGLCDAAPALIFYGPTDPRVSGLVLVNPFAYTMEGQARTYVKHYYWSRLKQPDYWRKVISGRFDARASMKSLLSLLSAGFSRSAKADSSINTACPLPERMRMALEIFKGRILVILSGNDLIARQFTDTVARSKDWQNLLASQRVSKHSVSEANHTFSRREWRDEVASVTGTWVKSF